MIDSYIFLPVIYYFLVKYINVLIGFNEHIRICLSVILDEKLKIQMFSSHELILWYFCKKKSFSLFLVFNVRPDLNITTPY